jgi:hypothetical protein
MGISAFLDEIFNGASREYQRQEEFSKKNAETQEANHKKLSNRIGNVGSTFCYMGIEMILRYDWERYETIYLAGGYPVIGAEYVDKGGVVRKIEIPFKRLNECLPSTKDGV